MKRTPLKRSTKPLPSKRSKPRRVSVVRDKKFLAELTMNYCEVGLLFGSEACSRIIDPAHGPVNGLGSKGGDDGAISLCRTHHREQHAVGWPVFEAIYGIDRAALAAEHYQRFKAERGA